jgi:hypothetical protein
LSYQSRLGAYEAAKRTLQGKSLTPQEYEAELKKLVKRYGI